MSAGQPCGPVIFTGDEGADIFRDLETEVAAAVLKQSPTVFDNPLLKLAETHGTGFLTGSAAVLVEGAVSERNNGGTAVEFEETILEAIGTLYLALINERRNDAAEIFAVEPLPFEPSDGMQQLVEHVESQIIAVIGVPANGDAPILLAASN